MARLGCKPVATLPYCVGDCDRRRGQNVLPPEAKTYFDSLSSAASADAWSDLANRQKDFERNEFARGQRPGGTGFAARLSALYRESLSARARAIVDALTTVHGSFNSPLDEGVDAQMLDWGARALSDSYQGLEGAYARHLQSFGIQPVHASGLDQTYALAQATLANLPTRYLWELRNVPAKRPEQASTTSPTQVTIHNSGTIGALQTGASSTANIQMQWVGGDTSELRAALAALREALEGAQGVELETRRALIADVDSAVTELQQVRPNKGRLLRWLGGIGALVGALGSVQPAFEAVKSLARALGLPL